MTGGAHLGILAASPLGIEARSMGIEVAPTLSRVTRRAIALGVTRDAGLETLPRCLPVADNEEPFGVVVARAQRTGGDDAGLLMT